jgi:hypothetical protein
MLVRHHDDISHPRTGRDWRGIVTTGQNQQRQREPMHLDRLSKKFFAIDGAKGLPDLPVDAVRQERRVPIDEQHVHASGVEAAGRRDELIPIGIVK